MNTIKFTDVTGNEVEIDAAIIASKIEEIGETNRLGCSETEWLIDCIKNYKEIPKCGNAQEICRNNRKER